MSKQRQKFKFDLKTILTLIVLAAALVLGVFNGWQDAEDKGAAAVPAYAQELADYIFENGELPERFITKAEAQKLGWDSSKNDVSDVAPGKAIGGDRFGNREGLLPDKSGRTWYEADVNYESGNRGAERIVYSSDGLVYYTADHYESFTEVKPSK